MALTSFNKLFATIIQELNNRLDPTSVGILIRLVDALRDGTRHYAHNTVLEERNCGMYPILVESKEVDFEYIKKCFMQLETSKSENPDNPQEEVEQDFTYKPDHQEYNNFFKNTLKETAKRINKN